jgi:hypothetical protein
VANTELIKSNIHPYVRDWLKEKYGVKFGRSRLPLRGCEGVHYFDAVSSDGKIAAEIKTASGRTSGGKHPSGKRASAFEPGAPSFRGSWPLVFQPPGKGGR